MTKYHQFSASTAKKQALAFMCLMCLVATSLWAQPAQLTISKIDRTQVTPTKVYDGTTNTIITHLGALEGLDSAHTQVALYGTAHYITPNVGGIKSVVVTYTLGDIDSAYYLAPQNDTLLAAITPKPLTVTGTTVDSNKVYNGGTVATITNVGTPNGIVAGDTVYISALGRFDDPNVGNNKNVTVTYMLSGVPAHCANYIVPAPASLTANITPLQLYAPLPILQANKVYDGTITCNVVLTGELTGMIAGDEVYYRATASFSDPNVGQNKPVSVYSYLYGPKSGNYTVVDTSTRQYTANILPLKLTVDGAVVNLIKDYDGTDTAIILAYPQPTNLIGNDAVTLITTARYDDPNPGSNKTITLSFRFPAVTPAGYSNANYTAPDDIIYSTLGKIILPTILDTTVGTNGFIATNTHNCPGSQFNGTFTLAQGSPTYYTLEFDDNALAEGFINTTNDIILAEGSNTFNIAFDIPANCAPGTYSVTFRIGNESMREIRHTTTFNVNLSNTYLVRVFNDVVSVDNRNNTFNTYQWYLNDNPIEGATKAYYQDPRGYLNGNYSLLVNRGTEREQFICPITFDDQPEQAKTLTAYPNPVVNNATLKLTGFESEQHLLTIYNSYGTAVLRTTFSGQEYTIDMTTLPQGTYMINVDGLTAKTVKL